MSCTHTAVLLVTVSAAAAAVGSSYCSICSDHTMCIYPDVASRCLRGLRASGTSRDDQRLIVDLHNALRNRVASGQEVRGEPGPQPPAADMQRLKWDNELASIAQRWVDQCIYDHDSCRDVDRFYVGQNAAIWKTSPCSARTSDVPDWTSQIQGWYDEVEDLTPSRRRRFTAGGPIVGHYTQLVWANTTRVGCGYRFYQTGNWCNKLYICNYGEGGNWVRSPVYQQGTPRSRCDPLHSRSDTYPALC